jgi:hypothetical protein
MKAMARQRSHKTLTGIVTGTAVTPDIFQNPFVVAVSCQLLTGGLSTATLSIEGCYDWPVVYAPGFNGNTALVNGVVQTAAWFPTSIVTATITATAGTGFNNNATALMNFTTPVAALRANVFSATATSIIIVNFLQSVRAP